MSHKPSKRDLAVAAAVLLLPAAFVWGQATAPAPSKYEPTEIQRLRLEVKQRDAKLAQRDLADAQARFQAAVAALMAEGDAVREANGWPKDVALNPDTLTFAEPPQAAKPAAPGPGKGEKP